MNVQAAAIGGQRRVVEEDRRGSGSEQGTSHTQQDCQDICGILPASRSGMYLFIFYLESGGMDG